MPPARSPRPAKRPWLAPLTLVLRLLVMGLGLGVITGTTLRLLAPRLALGAASETQVQPQEQPKDPQPGFGAAAASSGRFEPRSEIKALSQQWQRLAAARKDLTASGFLLVLDDGRFAQLQSELPLPAASSIKTPILLLALDALDARQLRWSEALPMTKEVVGGGAGWMASRPVGSRFPLFEAATEMIRVSDNTATNLLIKRLGGKQVINQQFAQLGLPATVVNNWLPDLGGTNTTSSRDLARAIALVDTGEKLGPRARDLFREILGSSRTNTLIPLGLLEGLGKDAADPDAELRNFGITAYNKTGDIGIAYSDAALVQLPTGQRAVLAFMVKGPFNDPRQADLIRAMAAAVAKTLVGRP